MITQLTKQLSFLLLALTLASPVFAGELKPIMKEMRLHYKQALDATAAEQFNREIKLFLTELQQARDFDFSPERAKLSLEGLEKVYTKVSSLPPATEANLATLKAQFKQVDVLRKDYHKKVKPGGFEMLINIIKDLF